MTDQEDYSQKVLLRGWDATNERWRDILVNEDGKLIIDPSELFEDPPTDGEAGKAPTSNWAHDHAANENAHHTEYTDEQAQLIAAALIILHADIATAHQDAPDLILTHKGDANAHHTKYTDPEARAAAFAQAAVLGTL